MLSLLKLKKIWQLDNGKLGDIRTNKLTEDHFDKNAYSQMRVHLAVKVFSQSMIDLIKAHAEKCGVIGKYKSIIVVIEKLDRLVDICNGTGMGNQGIDKNCKCVDSPVHRNLEELTDILMNFLEWKKVNRKRREEGIHYLAVTRRFMLANFWYHWTCPNISKRRSIKDNGSASRGHG